MHHSPRGSFHLSTAAYIALAGFAISCNRQPATTTTTTTTAGPTTHAAIPRPPATSGGAGDTAWRGSAVAAHGGHPAAAARAMWAFEAPYGSGPFLIPEYNDEQRLYDGGGGTDYGPIVRLFASPYLSAITEPDQMNAYGPGGALVAVIDVDTPSGGYPFNPAYERLGINAQGTYCVALAHSGTNPTNNWSGFIYPVDALGHCQQPVTPYPTARFVVARADGGNDNKSYPAVARIAHDKALNPVIAVKCLNRMCEIGGVAAGNDDKPWGDNGGPGNGRGGAHVPGCNGNAAKPSNSNGKEWKVKGWHDEQRLAVDNGTGTHLKPSDVCAVFVPEPGLDRRNSAYYDCTASNCAADDTKGWKKTATIFIPTAVSGKYQTNWKFAPGVNFLELRKSGARDEDDQNNPAIKSDWDARIVDATGKVLKIVKNIHRHSHWDMIVPGTARFKWSDTDEELWVSCGMGCCEVDS